MVLPRMRVYNNLLAGTLVKGSQEVNLAQYLRRIGAPGFMSRHSMTAFHSSLNVVRVMTQNSGKCTVVGMLSKGECIGYTMHRRNVLLESTVGYN